MLDMEYKPAEHRRRFLERSVRASRALFRKFWATMRSCYKPEQEEATSTASTSTSHPHPRVSSPYRSIPYHRVSALMDVDYFRGSMNADESSQDGRLEILKVVNPDASIGSNSELGGSTIAERVNTSPNEATHTPCLPDLYFVASPEPSLSCMMTLSYDILTNLLREDVQDNCSACTFGRAESPPRGVRSVSSLNESPVLSTARLVTWNTMPRELFFTPLAEPEGSCLQRVESLSSRHSSRLTGTAGTSFSSDRHSTPFVASIDSLVDLVERFNHQWTRNARPLSDRTSRDLSSRISAISSETSQSSRQLSWSRGVFLSVDSLPLIPIVLAAARVAQKRRLRRKLARWP